MAERRTIWDSSNVSSDFGADDDIRGAIAAELETLSPDCRSNPARMDQFLADDFHEFGRSGGELTKHGTALRVAAATDAGAGPIKATGMRGELLAPGLVMIKYTSTFGHLRTNRTSLWRLTPDGMWQMFHHQGTPVAAAPPDLH